MQTFKYLKRDRGTTDVEVSKGQEIDKTAQTSSIDKELDVPSVVEELQW